jgi:hypothetical protein
VDAFYRVAAAALPPTSFSSIHGPPLHGETAMTFLLGMIALNIVLIYWFDIEDGLTQIIVCLATTIVAGSFL